MPPDPNPLEAIDISESLTLSVGWRSGQKIKLGQLTVGGDVELALREIINGALYAIDEREAEAWAPDADLSPETYLFMSQTELGTAPILASEHGEMTLVEALGSAESLPSLNPNDLPAADMQFYAITIGDTPGHRATFLRRLNPRRGLRGGKLLTSYHDVLTRIEDPVFAFDEYVDLIFAGELVLILSQSSFVSIFRAQQTLMAQVPRWTTELAGHVAITTEGQERLSAKAIRDSRMRTRLEAIVKRGHLSDVPVATIRIKMDELGLDQARLLDSSGNFEMEDVDIPVVLQFLNEDLFPGALTGVGFRADKKATH
jgi:hypothetical protein